MLAIKEILGVKLGCESNGIVDFGLPFFLAEAENHILDELFNENSPISDPLCLSSHESSATDRTVASTSLESSNLVGTNTFRQPDRTIRRDILVQALIQQYLSTNSMGDRPAEAPQ